MEQVHSIEEQKGLSCVYDYVNKRKDVENISIYDLSYIHEALYSKAKHPEFGGRYRNQDIYLLSEDDGIINGGNVELCPYWNITHEMNLLRPEVDELVKSGIRLGQNSDPNEILKYINDCVILKCKLIKIHPFRDGNGRSIRAFINLLFKLANIPPVYIENKEKYNLIDQMRRASTSIVLNISEGSSRKSKIERNRFYEIARGSIIEIDSCCEIILEEKYLEQEDLTVLGKNIKTTFILLSKLMNS